MHRTSRHISNVSKNRPSEASANLVLILQFLVDLMGTAAVLQRQATWKTPFPQIIFDTDDNTDA